jgi:hypothetical protein
MVRVPQDFVVSGEDEDDLIQKVFWELRWCYSDPEYLPGRAILTTTNANVDLINLKVTEMIPLPVGLHCLILTLQPATPYNRRRLILNTYNCSLCTWLSFHSRSGLHLSYQYSSPPVGVSTYSNSPTITLIT